MGKKKDKDIDIDWNVYAETFLDMKLRDFLKLATEHNIDCTLVAQALSVCSVKLIMQYALEKKIGADDEIKQS